MQNLSRRFFFLTALMLSGLIMTHAHAATYHGPYDYYQPAPDSLLEELEAVHVKAGITKARHGEFRAAIHEFEAMLRLFPNHPNALRHLTNYSLKAKHPEIALRYLKRAVRHFPKDASAHNMYGVYLHKQKKFNEAISAYKKALQYYPFAADIHYNLGLSYLENNNIDAAVSQAKLAYQYGFPQKDLRNKLRARGVWTAQETVQPRHYSW